MAESGLPICKIELPNSDNSTTTYNFRSNSATVAANATTANKLANNLTVKSDATYASSTMKTGCTYNGSSAVTVDVSPAAIGALGLNGGTVTGTVNLINSSSDGLSIEPSVIKIKKSGNVWVNFTPYELSTRDNGNGFHIAASLTNSVENTGKIWMYKQTSTENGRIELGGDVYISPSVKLSYNNTTKILECSSHINAGSNSGNSYIFIKAITTNGDIYLHANQEGYKGVFYDYEDPKGLIFLHPGGDTYQSCGDTLGVKMYYRAGDSFLTSIGTGSSYATGGYITNSGKSVNFSIPLDKKPLDGTTVNISSLSDGGIIVRQNGRALYGSKTDPITYVKPSFSATVGHNHLNVSAGFSAAPTETYTNNEPVSISLRALVTFTT